MLKVPCYLERTFEPDRKGNGIMTPDVKGACGKTGCRVTTCLENLEMSRNFKDVREKSWKIGKVWDFSGKY